MYGLGIVHTFLRMLPLYLVVFFIRKGNGRKVGKERNKFNCTIKGCVYLHISILWKIVPKKKKKTHGIFRETKQYLKKINKDLIKVVRF